MRTLGQETAHALGLTPFLALTLAPSLARVLESWMPALLALSLVLMHECWMPARLAPP